MKVNIKYFLSKKPLKNGTFQIYTRVTYRRKSNIIGEGIYLKNEQWSTKGQVIKHPNKKSFNLKLSKRRVKAHEIINNFEINGQHFDFQLFKSQYLGKDLNQSVEFSIKEKIEKCKPSTARKFRQLNSLINKYKKNAVWSEVGEEWIKGFETFLKNRNNKSSTIKTRLVNLKTVYNEFEKKHRISKSKNPFLYYDMPTVKQTPKAKFLTVGELSALLNYNSSTPREEWAKKLFLFSLYCRGMNFTDMALLKWECVTEKELTYFRSKTNERFDIRLNQSIKQILDWATGRGVKGYVFDILTEKSLTTERRTEERINNQTHRINQSLELICLKAGINKKITTYSARHTFSNLLKRSGVSTDMIKDLLGHSEIRTTQAYLAKFDNSALSDVADKITEVGEAR